jgi:hypothetical protein
MYGKENNIKVYFLKERGFILSQPVDKPALAGRSTGFFVERIKNKRRK